MRVNAEMVILGTETIPSKKVEGKKYNQVNFLDGANTCNILCESPDVFQNISKIPQLTPVTCVLDIRLGRYTNANVVSCEKR